jgi:hypothetical protein
MNTLVRKEAKTPPLLLKTDSVPCRFRLVGWEMVVSDGNFLRHLLRVTTFRPDIAPLSGKCPS